MFNEKQISRKDFMKYLLGTFFSFLCIIKLPSLSFANGSKDALDSNDVKY